MILFPAIDIKDKKSVRLEKGDMQKCKIYGEPAQMAKKWQDMGAQYLHVVDLNSAFEGKFTNRLSVIEILNCVDIPVQLGGGIRTLDDIYERLNLGVSRVIIGTAAYENGELLEQAIKEFGEKIAVSLDARDMKLSVRGWAYDTDIDIVEFGKELCSIGLKTAVFTDISRDGMLKGPNTRATGEMIEKTGLNIIASGGMTTPADITEMKKLGAHGVILGKSIYENTIDFREAVKLC